MSHITFFNYVTGIAFGSIAAVIAIDKRIAVMDGLISLIVWALLTILIETFSLKFPKFRVAMDGEPTIVIKKGKIVEREMASMRLNMDDLSMLLREKNIFSLEEVDYAILEPHGKLSVLKKAEYEQITKSDMHLPVPPRAYLPTEIIVDGKVIDKNLKELNLNAEWLEEQLRKSGSGLSQLSHIFYAELQSDGTLYIDKREN
ncbi:DUF421 domain-containing protein [Paenibacillus piri]|uniref:DUF421 domain-containing protein n=2 Tax=Paenibacillus piri TaxID=2547395 RepID=A0A4R5KL93_9BACL|nr:DUF421 domain-containing protein [Paenibacillus piri]